MLSSGSRMKRTTVILLGILAVAAVIRLWNLTGPDILEDDTHYSMRAVGYFDYIGSTNTQTSPVVWFPEPQWWQHLSFHDAPPLVFAVQWFFFQIFGDNVFGARIPFVLAGLFAIWGMFLLGREATGKDWVGLVGAGALAVMNYHVWLSRTGLLDGFVLLWVIYALYFFLRARNNPKYYALWGMFCGLGMLTKYTFLFMGPLFLLLLLTTRRNAWRSKWLWTGFAIFLVLLLPIIIYNVMVWRTRGHFDAALSTMFGMHPDDFYGLSRSVTKNISSFGGVANAMLQKMSVGFSVLILLGIILAGVTLFRKRQRELLALIFVGIIFAWVMLAFAGGSAHYDAVLLPFFLLALGIAVVAAVEKFKTGKERIALFMMAIIAIVWEGIFAVQSELIPAPFWNNTALVEAARPRWTGYNALENYVQGFYKTYPERNYVVFSKGLQIRNRQINMIQSLYDQKRAGLQQEHLLVYDDRMDWSGAVWIFERRRLYDVAAIPSLSNLIDAIEGDYIYKFIEFGFKDAFVIIASDAISHNTIIDSARLDTFAKQFTAQFKPVQTIKNVEGEVVFSVYRVPLNSFKSSPLQK